MVGVGVEKRAFGLVVVDVVVMYPVTFVLGSQCRLLGFGSCRLNELSQRSRIVGPTWLVRGIAKLCSVQFVIITAILAVTSTGDGTVFI